MTLAIMVYSLPVAFAAGQNNSTVADDNIESRPYTADTGSPATVESNELPSMGGYLLKMIFSLAVIGGLAYATLRLFPRNLALGHTGEYITVYDTQPLGQNKGIYIAEIGGKVLALGVTDHNITILSEITDGDLIRDMRENHVARQAEIAARQDGWQKLLQRLNTSRDMPFSTHISRQISKLQQITQGEQPKVQGKDDNIE